MRSMPPSTELALPAGDGRGPGMGGDIASALAGARIGFASTAAAWPVLAGRAGFYALIMIVLSALWDKVGAEHVAGALALPGGGLAIYVGVTEWITFAIPSVHLRLEDDIRSGFLEPHLLRPKSYLAMKIAEALGGAAARGLAIGAAALGLLLVSGRAGPPISAWPAILLLGLLGIAVGTLLLVVVGLCAFWVRRVMPPYLIVQKLIFLLGGLFAPISFYPPWLRDLGYFSPFGANLAFAGQAAISLSSINLAQALALQLLWITALVAVAAAMWRAGLAKTLREGV